MLNQQKKQTSGCPFHSFLQSGDKDVFIYTYASLQDFYTSYTCRSPMRLEEGMRSRRAGSANAGKGNQVLCNEQQAL